jgi:hypothetical protein
VVRALLQHVFEAAEEARHEGEPGPIIVDLRAFSDRNFAAGCVFSFVMGIGLYGLTYLYPPDTAQTRAQTNTASSCSQSWFGPSSSTYSRQPSSWHWLFLINIVPGIFVTISTFLLIDFDRPNFDLRRRPSPTRRRRGRRRTPPRPAASRGSGPPPARIS